MITSSHQNPLLVLVSVAYGCSNLSYPLNKTVHMERRKLAEPSMTIGFSANNRNILKEKYKSNDAMQNCLAHLHITSYQFSFVV
jgi:hypothetical protein